MFAVVIVIVFVVIIVKYNEFYCVFAYIYTQTHICSVLKVSVKECISIVQPVKSITTNYLSLKQMILKFFYVMIINFLLLVTLAHIRSTSMYAEKHTLARFLPFPQQQLSQEICASECECVW